MDAETTTGGDVHDDVVSLELQVRELWRRAATGDSERLVQGSRALRAAARARERGTSIEHFEHSTTRVES